MASHSLACAFPASPVDIGGKRREVGLFSAVTPTTRLLFENPPSRCFVVTAFASRRPSQSSPASQGNPFADLKRRFPVGSIAAEPANGQDDRDPEIDGPARSTPNNEDFVIIRKGDSSGRTDGESRTAGGGGGKRVGSTPSRGAPSGRASSAKGGNQQAGKSAPVGKGGAVTVQATRRGRGGKTVTVIEGLRLSGGDAEVAALVKKLKAALGSGGAVKDGCIEIQGDVADRVVELLGTMGVQAKRSGGR